MNIQTNIIKTDVQVKPKANTTLETPVVMLWRYFCDGCTGIAFRSSNKMPFTKIHCQNCGMELTTYKESNYLPLN